MKKLVFLLFLPALAFAQQYDFGSPFMGIGQSADEVMPAEYQYMMKISSQVSVAASSGSIKWADGTISTTAVTRINAGPNITISPVNGVGAVTITASGGAAIDDIARSSITTLTAIKADLAVLNSTTTEINRLLYAVVNATMTEMSAAMYGVVNATMTTITNYADRIAGSTHTVAVANNEVAIAPATAGNVFTWCGSSPSWNAPAAGGAAAVYPEIALQAYDFTTDGFTDTATLTSVQFQQTMEGVVSSPTVTFLKLKGGLNGAVNTGKAQFVVPRSWMASDTNAYATWGTTCTPKVLGQVFLHMLVSTSSLSGIYTQYDATNTAVACTPYIDNLITSTFTITGLTAGQNVTLYISRPSEGTFAQSVYLRSVTLGKN